MVGSLELDDEVQIEMRFKTFDYDSLWQLHRDTLIDVRRTPQSKASIRVVPGGLFDFVVLL